MAHSEFARWTAEDKDYLAAVAATTVFKCLIQGALIAGTHRYYSRICSQDGRMLRTYVGVVMGLEILHTTIAIAKMYLILVNHIYWPKCWLNSTDTMLNGTICFLSQLFFAHRCWRVTHKSTIVSLFLMGSLILVFLGDIGVITVEWLSFGGIHAPIRVLQATIGLWGFASAWLELVVTSILFHFLWKSRTGIRGLDKVILRLFTVSLESSLPCLVSVLLTNLTVLLKNVSANFFAYSTASLYGLSLMISLNGREKAQDTLTEFRQEGAMLNFGGTTQPNFLDSQFYSDSGDTSRRGSEAAGSDKHDEYRRPSIVSFIKEVF